MKQSDRRTWIALALLVLLLGVVGVYYSQGFAITNSDLFLKPQWGRLECAEDSIPVISVIKVEKSGSSVYCSELTNECTVKLDTSEPRWWSSGINVYYSVCDMNGENCGSEIKKGFDEGQVQDVITSVPTGKKLWVECKKTIFNVDVECDVSKTLYPYKLYAYYGGAKKLISGENCDVPNNALSGLLKEDKTNTIQKGLWENFVYDWVYGSGGVNVVTYNAREVYCSAGNIYEIVTITMADNSIKKIDPTSNYIKADGSELKGLGDFISKVECCPSNPRCDPNTLKWTDSESKECEYSIECIGAGNKVCTDKKTAQQQTCVDNKCKWSEPSTVQCCSNTDCEDGKVCDGDFKCVLSEDKTGEGSVNEPFNFLPIYILGIIALIGGMLVLISKKINPTKGGKK